MARKQRRSERFETDIEEDISRSQRKRDCTAIQKVGVELVSLGEASLKTLDLSPDLMAAIIEWRGLPTREAKRRQMQFIGRLMRDVDIEPIVEALEALKFPHQASATIFHELESMRERLLEEGPSAVDDALRRWPYADRQQLRQLVRNAQAERKANRPPRYFRQLFKLLRDLEASAPASHDVEAYDVE